MTDLTITADDFGLCPEVNEAICLLHDRGIVQRTSFIVNTEHFRSSVEALRRRPALEVGIHLNLTDGWPVLTARQVPTLVNRVGAFRGGRHYGVAARILSGLMVPEEIRSEWEAQLERAKDAGIRIKHLNAHGHLHLLRPLHGIVADLLEQFAIPHLRVVLSGPSIRGFVFGLSSRSLVRVVRQRGLAVTFADRVLGLGRQGSLDDGQLEKALAMTREGASELIVHPALGENEYHRRWRYAGEVEAKALLSQRTALLLRKVRAGRLAGGGRSQ